jgi:uncharacterized protein (DUF1800 family)
MTDQRQLVSHVLRRMTFGPTTAQLERFRETPPEAVIEALLADTPAVPDEPTLGSDDDYDRAVRWWVGLMADPAAGLHERMVWFWHSHLTSSLDKGSPGLIVRQNLMVRNHALGNFRELMQAITLDAAMLHWLDGNNSMPDEPNENYAREVMELFTMGFDSGYTEDDVHYGAIALAGWWVDESDGDTVKYDDSITARSVPFLGGQVTTAEDVVNAVVDHPACAPYIAGKLYRHFHGVDPDEGLRSELARLFADNGLDLRPLVEAIVRHSSFLEHFENRQRTGLEWFLALRNLLRLDLEHWPLFDLGHVPFQPPNVAGWPDDSWLSVGSELTKARIVWDTQWEAAGPEADDPITEFADRCGLTLSASTRSVLRDALGSADDWDPFRTTYALIAMSPEFNTA